MACQAGASSPKAFTLTVIKAGTGDGTVSSSPSGLNCGEVCAASFKEGSIVTLTAAPDGQSRFETWSGDLTGTTNRRSLTMDRDKTVTVTFTRIAYTITGTVTAGGAGLEGVTMVGLPGDPVTDVLGQYSAVVPRGSSLTVTPTHAYYVFDPASKSYADVSADISAEDYAASLITTSQRRALIAFYNATSGDGWNNNSGWKTAPLYPDGFAMPGTESGWYGLTVDPGTQAVTGMDVAGNNLVGTIPAELGDLTSLANLNLHGNSLTGSIPSALGNLTALRELQLYSNQLTGPIPAEIGLLANLTLVDLGKNQLTGTIPADVGRLTKLYKLYLNDNQLSGSIPAELGSLSNLGYLYLHANELSGSIPLELCSLPNLRQLFLYSNKLSGSIPPELGNMISLQWIVLRYNQLSGEIPAELGNLTDLQVLRLGDNQLSGEIPAELGNLVNLQSLRLAHNRLSGGIPATLGNLTQLWEMLLNSNRLTGLIPASLANLTALTATDFGYNALDASDEALRAFLNTKDPDWAATQTIAPAGITATSLDNAVIMVSWLPIAYSADAGHYAVMISETPGGPYTPAGQTENKITSSAQVTDLVPGHRYYFVVQTHTDAHSANQNIVESESSAETSAEAWTQTQVQAAAIVAPSLMVTSPNGGETWAAGSAHAIAWTQTGLTGPLTVDLYKGGLYQKTLGTAEAASGSFSWRIGAGETRAADYTILVWQIGCSDDSDASFAVVPAVKVDFNHDGQEDVLWRYHGSGGHNRVWFLGNIEEPGEALRMTDPPMGARAESSGIGTPSKGLLDPRDIGVVSETRQESLPRDVREAMNAVEERGSEAAMVDDPRRMKQGDPGPAPTPLADPRSVKPDAGQKIKTGPAAEILSAPIMLGGADVLPVDDTAWEIAAVADFNNDTHADILWRHNGPGGENVLWLMDGTDGVGSAMLPSVPDPGWQIVGTGDFNNDTHIDILWRHGGGSNLIWYMSGTEVLGCAELAGVSDPAWQIVGTGDFNKDGNIDVLWHDNGRGGPSVVWYLNGTVISGSADLIPVTDSSWQVAGTGDFNNDGHIDILWRHYGPGGSNYIWYMNQTSPIGGGEIVPEADLLWRIVSRQEISRLHSR